MKILRMFVVLIAAILLLAGFGCMWRIMAENPNSWTGFDKSHLFSAYGATVAAFVLISGWLLFELRSVHAKLNEKDNEN